MKQLCCAPLLGGLLALPLLSGCGQAGPKRYEVTGKVTYQGLPVEDGIISFEPLDGQGSKDGAQIQNGQYQIPRDKGLFPGRYRVSIIIGDGTTGAGDASPDAPRRPVTPGKERAPRAFNLDSQLVREITPDKPNTFDFEIP